jgi:DNA-binding response OmpR family regulator
VSALDEINFKILIVDENVTFRNNLASKLRIQGYTVEFASGGFHLLHTLERIKEYNLLIIHEDMLDMSAEEMISLIRINKTKSELPILFISQNDSETEIAEMVSNGANEYIIKSSNFQPIIEKTQKYFTLFKNS